VGEVLEMPDDELLKIRNFGEKSLVELRERLAERRITPQRSGGSGDELGDGEQLEPLASLSADDLGDLIGGTQAAVAEMADASPLADEQLEGDDDDEDLDDNDDTENDEE
jgi:hypothetical protein